MYLNLKVVKKKHFSHSSCYFSEILLFRFFVATIKIIKQKTHY